MKTSYRLTALYRGNGRTAPQLVHGGQSNRFLGPGNSTACGWSTLNQINDAADHWSHNCGMNATAKSLTCAFRLLRNFEDSAFQRIDGGHPTWTIAA